MQALNNNLASSNSSAQTNYGLDRLIEEFEHWHLNKTKPGMPIPNELWEKIFALADTHSDAKLRALLGISSKQYRNKYEQFCAATSQTKPTAESDNEKKVKLCQVNMSSSLPQSKPIAAFNTIVVECCRSDGQTLKIHTTNENINTVIKAFYAGFQDATDHP